MQLQMVCRLFQLALQFINFEFSVYTANYVVASYAKNSETFEGGFCRFSIYHKLHYEVKLICT